MVLTWMCEHGEVTVIGAVRSTLGEDWPPCPACRQRYADSPFQWDDDAPPIFPAGSVRRMENLPPGCFGFTMGPFELGKPDEPPDEGK
jgi:hypothetical protein